MLGKKLVKTDRVFHGLNKHQLKDIQIGFNMKIGLCGTVSVGKTTLVNALKELPEFKDYTFATERSKYLRDLGIPLNTDSTLKGQTIFLAERCSELIQENIITDRTIIDVMAFTMCAKSIDPFDKDRFDDYASRFIEEYDWIFYVSPAGVDIEDNSVRTTDAEYRDRIDQMIKYLYSANLSNIKNFGIISGSTKTRIELIKSYLGL
jgi:ATPase subunit of ABC transporter with duplicated ATPase domains